MNPNLLSQASALAAEVYERFMEQVIEAKVLQERVHPVLSDKQKQDIHTPYSNRSKGENKSESHPEKAFPKPFDPPRMRTWPDELSLNSMNGSFRG